MFSALNDLVGWGHGVSAIPSNASILLGDSGPIDSLPLLLSFVNMWLKTPSTAVIFLSFRTAQPRLSASLRKIYGVHASLLAAQSRFQFVDAVAMENDEMVVAALQSALDQTQPMRTLLVLEGFSCMLASGVPLTRLMALFDQIETRCYHRADSGINILLHWSRDLEHDYPGHSRHIRENVAVGGQGWLHFVTAAHYVFCARPLRSGMTRDVIGEIVAVRGPRCQSICENVEWTQDRPPFPLKSIRHHPFHPTVTLYRAVSDTAFACVGQGATAPV